MLEGCKWLRLNKVSFSAYLLADLCFTFLVVSLHKIQRHTPLSDTCVHPESTSSWGIEDILHALH